MKRRVGDLQEQLAILRRKIRQIDRKYAARPRRSPRAAAPAEDFAPLHHFIDEFMSGEVVETPHGTHFETEKLYARHRRHGSMDISTLAELPEDLLDSLSDGVIPPANPVALGVSGHRDHRASPPARARTRS